MVTKKAKFKLAVENIGYVKCQDIYPGKAVYLWYFKDYHPEKKGKVLLLGTGASQADTLETNNQECFKQVIEPLVGLAKVGIYPKQVDAIVLDHAHWDHLGALTDFPRARIFIHRKELAEVLAPRMNAYFDVAAKKIFSVRKQLFILEAEQKAVFVSPAVSLLWTGGHSPGHLVMLVETTCGRVLFGGDLIMLSKNIHEPFLEFYHSREEILAFYDLLPLLAPDVIISGHDAEEQVLHPNGKLNIS